MLYKCCINCCLAPYAVSVHEWNTRATVHPVDQDHQWGVTLTQMIAAIGATREVITLTTVTSTQEEEGEREAEAEAENLAG